jgi:hypothetical protein
MFHRNLLLLALVALLVTDSAFGQQREADRGSRDRSAIAVADLQRNIRDARKLLSDINDRELRERLELLLSRAALIAEDLGEPLTNSSRGGQKLPVSDADFAKLLKNLKDQSFDEQKAEFVKSFVAGRPLNCEQAAEILKTFSFDDGRIASAVILYPSLVDPANFFEALKVFSFESTRKQVMDAVRKK